MRFFVPAIVTAALVAPVSADPPKVGERHPDFTLPALADGKPKSLSDFRGKKVLLIQFASW